jgi:hypothetical protein
MITICIGILVTIIIISRLVYKCYRQDKNITTDCDVVPIHYEIPVVEAYIVQEYPQPSAPPIKPQFMSEKIDIEMGLEQK